MTHIAEWIEMVMDMHPNAITCVYTHFKPELDFCCALIYVFPKIATIYDKLVLPYQLKISRGSGTFCSACS
jgi:hypothetical protein